MKMLIDPAVSHMMLLSFSLLASCDLDSVCFIAVETVVVLNRF